MLEDFNIVRCRSCDDSAIVITMVVTVTIVIFN